MNRIGVLALQGDFEAHAAAFRRVGAEVVEVRRTSELEDLCGLVIPGGESTTLLNLMRDEPWFDGLQQLVERGAALWGTCAGAILLARQVYPLQESLGLVDSTIERNAYGRQIDSFETEVDLEGDPTPFKAMFIRAPRFKAIGPEVEVLGRLDGEPVLVRQGKVMAGTFHPELTEDPRIHRAFFEMADQARAAAVH